MNMRLSIASVVILIETCLWPAVGESAMVKRSLEQLSQEADTIVVGTITRQVSTWNDQHTAIRTDVTVTVEEHIKGWRAVELTFRVAGGTVGGVGMRTSNDPAFRDGDRVILFLHTAGIPATLVGRSQGAYVVHDEKVIRDGHRVAARDFVLAIRAVNP